LQSLTAKENHPGPEILELAVRESVRLSGLARNEGEYLRALAQLRHGADSAALLRKVAPSDRADYWQNIVNWNLAIVLSQTGDLRGAESSLEEAGRVAVQLASRRPENASYVRQVWVTRQARALFAGS